MYIFWLLLLLGLVRLTVMLQQFCINCIKLGIDEKACTSKLCLWNMSRRKMDPVPLQEMSFKRPRKEDLPEVLDPFEDPEPFSFKDPLLNNVSEKRNKNRRASFHWP